MWIKEITVKITYVLITNRNEFIHRVLFDMVSKKVAVGMDVMNLDLR